MKEITRIHLAKTPYDVELVAKQELEAYLRSLEAYSDDREILDDVEIRMTEILAERSVKSGGVISETDVEALRTQLGEPQEFAGDDVPAADLEQPETSRKLFRDLDRRWLGGVLAGIGAYFRISPVWVRLLFIILALASFGTALIVYVVLWIAVPPARSAADKLQMTGRPVTVAAIRELSERDVSRSADNGAQIRRVLTILLGIACVFGALVAAGITVTAGLALPLSGQFALMDAMGRYPMLLVAFVLALCSGLLLVTLFVLGAFASFAQKLSVRVAIALGVVVVLGLASFGTAIGLGQYGSIQIQDQVQEHTKMTTLKVPSGFATASGLAVKADGVDVTYVVTSDAPHATLRALYADTYKPPKVSLAMDGDTLELTATQRTQDCSHLWGCVGQPVVTVYGPALRSITGSSSSAVTYEANRQGNLAVNVGGEGSLTLSGQIDSLVAQLTRGSQLDAGSASIVRADLTITNAESVELGAVSELTLATREACASYNQTTINVDDVASGHIMLNGEQVPATYRQTTCTELAIDSSHDQD